MAVVSIEPGALELDDAAAFVSLSPSTWQRLVREERAPQPRSLSDNRVGWLVEELREWLRNRPVSSNLPPQNTGAKKPRRAGGRMPPTAPQPA